jgi:hypothetical protein
MSARIKRFEYYDKLIFRQHRHTLMMTMLMIYRHL